MPEVIVRYDGVSFAPHCRSRQNRGRPLSASDLLTSLCSRYRPRHGPSSTMDCERLGASKSAITLTSTSPDRRMTLSVKTSGICTERILADEIAIDFSRHNGDARRCEMRNSSILNTPVIRISLRERAIPLIDVRAAGKPWITPTGTLHRVMSEFIYHSLGARRRASWTKMNRVLPCSTPSRTIGYIRPVWFSE
jgi:hypothetical protein